MQLQPVQNIRENRDIRIVAALQITDLLDGLERFELSVRCGERNGGECERRRTGVEQTRAVTEDVATVIFAEGLAGQREMR